MPNSASQILLNVLAAVATMAFASVACAAVFNDGFDPDSNPVPFNGNATFLVPQSCLDLGPGTYFVNYHSEAACTGVELLSLSATYNGDSFTFSGHDTADIFGIILEPGPVALQGIDSDPIYLNCSGPNCGTGEYPDWYAVFSQGADVSLCNSYGEVDCNPENIVSVATTENFSNPEPGSLALIGGALAAGWFGRRRKKAA
ncbi:MAG TPA: PEP-CTERM sorting domain-containing protein [Casimicrobiaceae bacterium]|nr:PEP-CTERM sorting domain-containing protein [Casimicrobiaceae bacterium]